MAHNAVYNISDAWQSMIYISEGPVHGNMMNDNKFLKELMETVHNFAARFCREDSEFVDGFAKWRGPQGGDFTNARRNW